MDISVLIAALLTFGFGFVNCFFGYRIFSVLLTIWGFVIGALVGAVLFADSEPLVILIVGAIAGVIGALIVRLLYYVGIFVMGAVFGLLIGSSLMLLLSIDDSGGIGILVLLAAIIGGLIALALQKLMIILATSFSGAAGMVNGVLMLVPGAYSVTLTGSRLGLIAINPAHTLLATVATIILGIIGVIVQYRAENKKG